jgi:hypothetical protein
MPTALAFGAHAIRFNLRELATLVERVEGGDVERETASREIPGNTGRITP